MWCLTYWRTLWARITKAQESNPHLTSQLLHLHLKILLLDDFFNIWTLWAADKTSAQQSYPKDIQHTQMGCDSTTWRSGCYFQAAGRTGYSSGFTFYSISGAEANMQKETNLRKQVNRARSPAFSVVVAMVSSSPLFRDVAGQSIPKGAEGRVPGARSPGSLLSDLTSMILLGNTHHSLLSYVGIRGYHFLASQAKTRATVQFLPCQHLPDFRWVLVENPKYEQAPAHLRYLTL